MVEAKKRFMFINRRAPYGTIYGLEALDAMLAGSAFEQDISVVFLDGRCLSVDTKPRSLSTWNEALHQNLQSVTRF